MVTFPICKTGLCPLKFVLPEKVSESSLVDFPQPLNFIRIVINVFSTIESNKVTQIDYLPVQLYGFKLFQILSESSLCSLKVITVYFLIFIGRSNTTETYLDETKAYISIGITVD